MRPNAPYMALRDIPIPDSYAFAARQGDDVFEDQRLNLGLVVGLDIEPQSGTAMERPAEDAERLDWQNYAVVRGVPYSEAANLDRDALVKRVRQAEKEGAPAEAYTMPEPADRKDRWQDYAAGQVVRRTQGRVTRDEARDRMKAMTKDQLVQAFGPDGDGGPTELYDAPAEGDASSQHSADPVADQGNPDPEK